MDRLEELDALFKRGIARVSIPNKSVGAGFFVAPDLLLTCAHVVGNVQSDRISVIVQWKGDTYTAKILRLLPEPYPDLALLKLVHAPLTHPCAYLKQAVRPDDNLRSYGYPQPRHDIDPSTFIFEGTEGDPPKFMKLKFGEARPGFSGAPVLNQRTGAVCGIMVLTRGENTLMGGRAIPISVGKSSFLLAVHKELQSREDVCGLIYDAASLMDRPLREILSDDFHQWGPLRVEWTTRQLWEKINNIDGIDKRHVLFCIDALNEQEREQAKVLLKQINELLPNWPWLKVVIVSRPEAWQFIKSGVNLPKSRYYQRDGGTLEDTFNYSERLEPFSRQERPLVYEKYRQRYQVQTSFEELSSRLRDIISDPFHLRIVTEWKAYKVIPEDLKITTLIGDYVKALIKQGKLQGGDDWWLEKPLVPLMVSEEHYEKVVTSKELYAADQALLYALLDSTEKSGLPQLQRFINLADAGILEQKSHRDGFAISFKSERYYDYFIGRRLFHMRSEDHAGRYDYFLNMIGRTIDRPYLWGAVRNALVQEAKQSDIEIVLKLCRKPNQHVKEMMVSVLTTLDADARQQVERILKELVPAVRRATTIKKVRQWQGKAKVDADLSTVSERNTVLRNAGRIATEVASNLNMPWLLQIAALQEDSTIRTEAIRFAYHLWKRDHQAGFAILEHLTQEITSGLIPEKVALESTIGLSICILFDSAQDEQVLRRLQGFWHDIVARMLVGEYGNLWEHILRRLFFPPEQMERDYLAVMMKTNNYLIVFIVQLGLIAHACQDPLGFLPFLQSFYEEAKKDVVAYPYMNDVIHVLDNVLHRGSMDDPLFDFFVFAVQECQGFYIRHPEAIRNSNYKTKPEVHDLGPYIFHVYRKTESVKTDWLELRIQSALEREDTRFFDLLLISELLLIGIERQSPKAASLTVAMFFQQMKGSAAIRSETQEFLTHLSSKTREFLAHLRAYYPNEVDEFLEEQDADNDFRVQVQRHEPEENIAALIGQKSLYFLRDDIIMQSPILRSRMQYLLAQAADCRSIRVWLDYFLRELINLLYGGEILHLPE